MRKALFLLGILDDSDLDWMLQVGAKRDVPAGTILIQEGRSIADIYVIIDGLFAVRTSRTASTDVARLRSGEIVGEMSFVDTRPPSASVVSLEPSLVLAIPRASLEAKLAGDVAFASRFYRSLAVFLSDRLRSTVGRLGYGGPGPAAPDDAGASDDEEMDPATLDALSIAGARFDFLQRKLRSL